MNDDELYAELIKRIARNAQAVGEPPTAIDFAPGPEEPATRLRLHVSPASLGEHLRGMQRDGELAFPDRDPLIGALQLFLVHVDEAVQVRDPGQRDLVPGRGGVWAVDPGGVR